MIKIIKKIWYKFVVLSMNLVYFFFKLLPTQNKVSFHSRLVQDEPLDFRLIREEIKKRDPQCETALLAKRLHRNLIGEILYIPYLIKRMYHIATSKACVIDSYIIPISVLHHKKNLIVIQIPHGMGCIKKVGYQTLEKIEGDSDELATEMRMHKNYDYVIANGPEAGQWYVEGYRIDPEIINLAGMPRIDYLRDTRGIINPKLKEMCPTLNTKKTIVYIPTFRREKDVKTEELIDAVNYSKYNLVITCHPNHIIVSDNPNVIISTNEDVMYHEWIKACDYFISDYSAVIFEAMLLNKKIYFYVYDFDEYKENRGLNLDWFKELPQYTSKDAKEIIKLIEKDVYDLSDLDNIKDRYLSARDNQCTKEIADLIYKG